MKKQLKNLLKIRKELIKLGEGWGVLEINERIAVLARKLGLNYYELN